MTTRGRLVQRAARRGAVLLSRQILAVVLSLAMIQWPTTYALARPAAATEVAISTEVAAGKAAPSTDTAADSADTENSAAAQDETPVHTWKFDLAGGKLADSVGATDPTKIDDVTISGDDEATLLDTGLAADVSNVKDVFATGELVRDGYVFRGWAYDTKTTASDGLPQTIIPAGAKVSGLVFSYDEDKDGTTETTVVPDKFVDPQEGAPEGSGVATLHAVWEKVAETAASAQDTGAAESEAEPATSAEDQSSAEASAATTSEDGEADTQADSSRQEEEAATPSDAATNAATLSEDVIASSPTAREALREGTANAGADVKDIDQGAGDDLKAEVTTNDTPAAAPVQRFFSTLASAASGAIGGDVTSADGTTINSFEVKWVTPDSHNNDDKIPENLVFAPYSNASINLRGKVSFSLSGEHDYQPGDISFTLPGHIFTDRSDKPYGSLALPLAEAPSTKTNFNWSYDSGTDTYTITNTGTMSAASSVEIEFGITDVTPSEVVDSKTFGTINSTLFVTTNAGSGLHATAGGLTAQVNTQEVLGRASKIYQSYESTDDLSRIPDEVKEKYPDEKKFLLVTYYTYAYHFGCTYYTLAWKDTPTDSFGGTPIENGDGIDLQDSYRPDGNSNYHYVTIAYPFSQFEAGKHYTLTNSVEWTLTQTDPNADGTYASSVQQATATCNFYYSKPTVKHPGGRFDADKVGEFGNKQPDWSLGDSYPTALNSLSAGKDVSDISYKSSMIGYVLPYLQTEGTEGTKVSDFESSKSVHMQIEDGKLDFADTKYGSGTLSPGVDYEFTALGLDAPKLLAAVEYDATLLDASKAVTVDGRAVYDEGGRQIHGGSYGIGYTDDADLTHSPDFVVQAQVGGAWKDVAAVSWKTGSVFYADGSAQSFTPRSGVTVSLPAGTTSWRYGADVNIAGIREAVVHPKVKLHPTSEVRRLAQDQIADSTSPAAFLRNTQSATATQGDEILFQQEDAGADELRGYDVKIAAVPSKDAMTDPNSDVNYEDSNVTLHYSAKVELQSDIADKDAYESAVANGDISSQTSGVWYDLLPKGVVPNLSTIDVTRREVRGSEVSSADGVKSVRTIDNYKGTGRTLLVVGVSLVPTAQAYLPGNSYTYMYEDVPQIRFDATYSFNDSSDWGTDLHNVIAFEGGSSELAQREGYQGEPDSPDGKNTVTDAATTFVDEAERSAMTDLDPASSAQNVVYAGASTSIQKLNYYTFSLSKQVDVNNEGSWGTGVGTADQPNANAKNAWAGGPYSYRLSMVSGENSSTSNMVIYDELENYVPTEDKPDVNGKRWRGALVSVDVSQLRAKGIDAKVYYSSKPDIDLANDSATGLSGEVTKNADSDLANTSVWSLIPPDDLSRVTAIAVDASTATDGSPFVLASYDTATVRVNMVAPSGEDASALIDEDAHAYNSAYMSATGTNSATGVQTPSFIRKDYTKVGLSAYSIQATKLWMDNGNSDGYRPDSLAVDLLANGETTDRSLMLDEANGWAGSFENIPYLDSDGKRIDYTLKERSVSSVGDLSKYHGTISWTSDKTQVYLTNVHEPETVSIHGHKVWNNDPENAYHSYVYMCLLADGKTRLDDGTYLPAKTVYEGEDGSWSFSFDNMPKYHDGGVPYEYSLQEQRGDQNYSPSISGDVSTGFTVTNTYHPFGDLVISKAVTGGTEETKGQRFTFDVQLWNQDGSPLRGTTTWQRSDGSTGSITDGVGVVDLADGEAITLKDIPAYATYSVTERQTSGYHASSSMLQGYISANRQSDAAFSNEYSTLGRASIGARKVLDGRTLINHQFRFLLLDGDGEVVSVGSNDASGAVTFGSLRYSAADDGKTFSYTMREEDAGMPGYTYDSREYKVEVTPHDMGDGTMEVEVRYLDGNGSRLDPQDVSFGNSYTATGSTHLTAYKVLKDGRLERGAFSFELHGVDTAPLPEVTSATNAVDGTVNWGDITYSQKDIGKTYTYWADEMAGTDESVAYSAERRAWSVSVFDNGDGTLSFATKNISTDGLFDADGNVVPGWDASKASATDQLPVITNQSKSGELDISKMLTDDEETQGQKDRGFTFRVTLTGPSVTSDTVKSYQVTNGVETFGTPNSQAGSSSDKPDQSSKSADMAPAPAKSLLQTLSDAWGGLVGSVASLFVPTPALANTTDDSGVTVWKKWGTARWGIDGDGTLWLEPESGSASDTGYLGNKPASYFEVWDDHNADVKEIMTKGRVVLPVWSNHLFYNFVNCTYADVSGLDPSRSRDIQRMFSDCKKLKTIVGISDWDTRTVLYPYQIFEGCESLTEIDLSGWDLHNAWQDDDFFAGCKSLRKITLGPQFRSSKRGMPDIPAYHTADPYDGKWMLEGKGIVLSAADLRDTYSPELAGTWVWAIVTYPLKFDANGGTGAMQDQTLAKGEKTPIPANTFTRFGYTFAGWNTKPDGTGDVYADQAQIAIRQDTTLYAQWTKADNTVTMEDNGFTVTLKGGETAKIDALPSGTAYQVYEETPSGWVLVSSSNASGSIEPLKTSTATFTNKYEQGKVSANIVAHKTLDGLPVDEGAFSFTLTGKDAAPMPTDAQGDVKTLTNAAGGGIDFGSIVFDKAGTYSYQLAEVAGTDESFTYDTHVEDVTVTVTDDGQGNLSAAVAYSGGKASGPTFANATKPGSLTVSKTVAAGKPDQEFTFDVTLTNPKNSAEPEVRTLTVKGGESATIDSLPAGTSYSVVERPSSGWTQTASEGATGTISANVASTASFTNSYAASGSHDIVIHKELVEATGATHPIEGGRFTFTIEGVDGAPLPATTVASNEPSLSAQGQGGDSAAVDFGSVTFQKEDMYTYRIREAAGSDEDIRYSDEVITLTVKTKDNGDGTLSCTPSYSGASGEGDDTITNRLVSKPPAPTPPESIPPTPEPADLPELLPQTGDSDPFGGLTTPVLGIAGCALAVAGYRRRRREGGSRGDA